MPFDSCGPPSAMDDLVVREDRTRRTAAPTPGQTGPYGSLKAQGCLELSSIRHHAGLGFLRVTSEYKRQTHQRNYEPCHRQMIVAFKRAARLYLVYGSETHQFIS